jgi:hypothetical protein
MFPEALMAFAVIALLALVLRWAFSRGNRSRRRAWPPDNPDYGLLVPVVVVDTLGEALRMRSRLLDAGIKATTAFGVDGRQRVLVFGSDLDRARRVVAT